MSMLGSSGQVERREGGQDRILTSRHVTIMPGRGGEVVLANTANLGPGGMFVATETPFAVGDRFICKIDLGENYKPVLSGGEVRWLNKPAGRHDRGSDDLLGVGVGVKFLDIAEAAQTLGGELPSHGPEVVRVRLESVGSAMDADVVERSGRELVLDVEIPFLQPGAQVEVGHDLSARSAEIRQVELSDAGPDDVDGGIKVRLWLDLEPSAVSVAADRVVKDAARDAVWPRRARRASPAPEPPRVAVVPEAPRPVSTPPALESPDDQVLPVPVTRDLAEPAAVAAELDEEAAGPDEEPRVEPAQAGAELEEPAEGASDRAAIDLAAPCGQPVEDQPAGGERPASGKTSPESPNYDDLNLNTLFPFWAGLEAAFGKERLARFVALVAHAVAVVRAHVNHDRLVALAAWARALAGRGWVTCKERLGPPLARFGEAARVTKLIRRRRRQVKGEPSRIVRTLTDRARRVAAGRGKAIAVAVLVAISLAGLATAGLGLVGSASAERTRDQLQSEAASAGWAAEQWQEPEPARAEPPNPS
jgi:Tfp pilus assembly protein PilZ